jgi:CheY-like chemotaxis protein
MTPGGQYRVYAEDLLAFLTSRGMRVPQDLLENAEDGSMWDRILIVDDDESINTLMKRYLTRRIPGVTVLQAFDGFEAGRQITNSRPGIIVLDISLPGIDGHRLCRRIKEDPGLGAPIIIAITGLPDENLEETIIAEGADAFFRKPLDLEKVRDKIEELATARSGRGVRNGR